MKKHLIGSFLFGILFSTIVYAVDKSITRSDISGNDIKIQIQSTDGEFASGRIMVNVDGTWYQFENSGYMRKIELGK